MALFHQDRRWFSRLTLCSVLGVSGCTIEKRIETSAPSDAVEKPASHEGPATHGNRDQGVPAASPDSPGGEAARADNSNVGSEPEDPRADGATQPVRKEPTKQSERPQNASECGAKCQGDWGLHGMSQEPNCNCRMKDAHKVCRDSSECSGACIGDPSSKEVVSEGPPESGFFLGKCSEFEVPYGCHLFLSPQLRQKGPYPLDDASAEICVD